MTFGTTLGKHFAMAASGSIFYVLFNYKNKTNMKRAASNINPKIRQGIVGARVTIIQQKISVDLTADLLLIFLGNTFLNSFMKMKIEKRTIFCFPLFIKMKNE